MTITPHLHNFEFTKLFNIIIGNITNSRANMLRGNKLNDRKYPPSRQDDSQTTNTTTGYNIRVQRKTLVK